MTKTELINKLAAQLNVSKKMAAEMLSAFIGTVTWSLANGNAVRIQGFGTFNISKRKARDGVNPQNPTQKIKIPARNVPTFKAGSELKAKVN